MIFIARVTDRCRIGKRSRQPLIWTKEPAASYVLSMRTTLLVLLGSATLALPLAGQSGPAVSPAQTTLRVGDRTMLHGYQHPGGLSSGFPYHYLFYSDDDSVATVSGFASGSSTTHPDD